MSVLKLLDEYVASVQKNGDRSYNLKTAEAYKRLLEAMNGQQETKWLTRDGAFVKPGDKVYVFGTGGIYQTTVIDYEPVTDYYLFGQIPVSQSFSSVEAAESFRGV